MRAANRDARRIMGEGPERVIDVSHLGEREEALLLVLSTAADRHGLRSSQGPDNPRPEVIDLRHSGMAGHCDICDARAHRLEVMHAQFGPYIFRARTCVRCRRYAPPTPDQNED
jgi:hypothetical protein